eukprot:Em0014g694a
MPEKYDLLEAALDPLLSEIKELLALKMVQVGGKSYELGFYLGGDLKANSKYSCIWCLVPSSDRWDTSKLHPTRSVEDIEAYAATNEYSVKYPPLLSIDLDHVMPDELHLFLQIMDIFIENLISYAVELDIRATRKQTDLLQGATLKKGFEETYSAISSWTPDSMVIETKVAQMQMCDCDSGDDVWWCLRDGAYAMMFSGAYVMMSSGAYVMVSSGAYVMVSSGAYVMVSSGAYVMMSSGAYVMVSSGAYVMVSSGAYVMVSSGAYVMVPM